MEELYFEKKSKFEQILDVLVFLSVFIVTIFLLLDLLVSTKDVGISEETLNDIYIPFGVIVLIVFSVDLYRLYKLSDSFSDFLKKNYLDIIATIPFGLIFSSPIGELLKAFRVFRLAKLSRIGKMTKEFKAAAVLKKKSEDYKKSNRI